MTDATLTPRQLEILRLIRDNRLENGYSPTMQEIGDAVGLTKVTVFEHVAALERKGVLLRGGKHKARSLTVAPDFEFPDDRAGADLDDSPTRLPLAGRIAAATERGAT